MACTGSPRYLPGYVPDKFRIANTKTGHLGIN